MTRGFVEVPRVVLDPSTAVFGQSRVGIQFNLIVVPQKPLFHFSSNLRDAEGQPCRLSHCCKLSVRLSDDHFRYTYLVSGSESSLMNFVGTA